MNPPIWKREDGMWCIKVQVSVDSALALSIVCTDRNRARLLKDWPRHVQAAIEDEAYEASRRIDASGKAVKPC